MHFAYRLCVCSTDCITVEVLCCFKHELIIHFGAGHTCFHIKIHSLTENVSWIYLYACVLTVYEGDHLTTEQRKHNGEHCNDLSLPRITVKLVTLPSLGSSSRWQRGCEAVSCIESGDYVTLNLISDTNTNFYALTLNMLNVSNLFTAFVKTVQSKQTEASLRNSF